MGNYISCSPISPTMNNSKAARVILPGGEIPQFREPTKAADLMLEFPAFFLANSKSLNIGRRFSALAADDDLEFGNVYILFPMKRVKSLVTAADMAVLFLAANSAGKRISGAGNVKVSPESGEGQRKVEPATTTVEDDSDSNERLNLESDERFPVPEFKYRIAACRSRKPLLDTITEEPICSRWKLLSILRV